MQLKVAAAAALPILMVQEQLKMEQIPQQQVAAQVLIFLETRGTEVKELVPLMHKK